jgi:alkyl hydroperoxide reductase subunit D
MKDLEREIPDVAKDLRLNLAALPKTESLSPGQLWGTVLASALASRNDRVIRAAAESAREHMDDAAFDAACTAAALMGMNNVYYRFVHLASNPVYGELPARLRMQGIANPGVPRVDFELWCLVVSAVNGCGACIDSHERALVTAGATPQMIQDAVRVASVVHAVAAVLDGERALAGGAS